VQADDTSAVLLWKSIHRAKGNLTKSSDIPKNTRLLCTYLNCFYISRTPDSPFITYPGIQIGHNKPLLEIREEIQLWLQDSKDTRKSTMGEVHTVGGSITSWKSQRQKTVSQLSSEAEYITLLEATKEKRFTQMLLREIAEAEEPGYILGDNEASIFLAKNKQVCTKHIDIREHLIRECVEEG
jgi:hypothetical protein